MIDPRTLSLCALCITHFRYLSFCLLLLIYLCLSTYLFSQFCFVSRRFYSFVLIIVRVLSVFSVAETCFSLISWPICYLSDYLFFEHVRSLPLWFFAVSTVYAVLYVFLLLIFNWSIMKHIGMLYLHNRVC